MVWTKENLKDVVREKIESHKFLIVSNREPYIHMYGERGIQCMTPASGMTVALDPAGVLNLALTYRECRSIIF